MAHWLDDAVFYEIYPQSFQDCDGDGIGDFAGIVSRLDYIRELGCNAVWINPCFDSSFYDAGYDVRDYYRTAERYGTNEDLKRLFDEAHRRGIRVLLDLVPGHTAIDSPWFQESCRDERNAWTDRYIWAPMNQAPDLNSRYDSIKGFLGGISERPDRAAVNCFSTQVCLNYGFGTVTEDWQFAADSPEAEAGRLLIQDIMAFWLGLGCDGFRVDMAASLVKEDPDHRWTSLLWRKVRTFLDERFPDAVLVSEWGNPAEALNAGFDMDFLLHFGPSHYLDLFRENPWFRAGGDGDVSAFVSTYQAMADGVQGRGLICIPSGNHDMIRMRDTLTPDEMKLAFAFLMTMPGCPFVYYGDEIGMRYVHGLKSKEGGYERTGSRTPMQWSGDTNAGFSAAPAEDLYLPLDAAEDRPTVSAQRGDDASLWTAVRDLIALRHDHDCLYAGAPIEFLHVPDHACPLVYRRVGEGETITVAINPSADAVSCPLTDDPGAVLHTIGEAAVWKDGTLDAPAGGVTLFVR
ncbi:alpha-amylase family glycosyl hydrolase [Bifidobacterium eulemuris]|uniref:Alpha-amylase n=1 Tax=Bifidobacterium eulemuris TaxID=1765219 RepID=A0A261GE32_9BIFI|nr:alpha-amylase family glycosyl hydrolase [Bifidobacterium eulemuris]OZG69688.1 alpha-amylase [Bifidobacterium eulemuris]QOL32207.1 DUF3459 domain-containing protein [Bifidobacterium eulemuris]